MTSNDTETSEAAHLNVVRAKTAALFAAASRIGAVVADRSAVEEEALDTYGMNLGIAFQLVDDVLDYSAREAEMGKAVGDDFRDGKITLPIILAFRRGSDDERDFWRRTLEEDDQRDDDLARAMELIQRHGALADTIERARHYGAMARDSLAIFPDCDERTILQDVVDFAIERAH